MEKLIETLGGEIVDPDEESFLLFAQDLPSHNLGFVDSKAHTIDLTLAEKDVTIRQSVGLLSSSRKEGTTGAVLWKITPLFAEWFSTTGGALLRRLDVLRPDTCALELGCGISGLISLTLAPEVRTYVNTDQEYVLRYVRENVESNYRAFVPGRKAAGKAVKAQPRSATSKTNDDESAGAISNIHIRALDWETTDPSSFQKDLNISGVDLIITCDCIYNEALVEPLVTTMRDLCCPASVCVVAQQLRSPDVFETWLKSFSRWFHVWRVPDGELIEGLREGSGYVVHIGVLK